MTETPEFVEVENRSGVIFTPWSDGYRVGFQVTRTVPGTEAQQEVRYIYLGPLEDDAGEGHLVVYAGATGDPQRDPSLARYVLFPH